MFKTPIFVLFLCIINLQLWGQNPMITEFILTNKKNVVEHSKDFLYVITEEAKESNIKNGEGEETQKMYDAYNEKIKTVVTKYWKFSKVKYITWSEANNLTKDQAKNALFLASFHLQRNPKKSFESEFLALNIKLQPWMLDKEKVGELSVVDFMQVIAFMTWSDLDGLKKEKPFNPAYAFYHHDMVPTLANITIGIRSMQNHMAYALTNSKPAFTVFVPERYKSDFGSRTIVFNENIFGNGFKIEDLQAETKFKMVAMSQEQIDKILFEGNKKYYVANFDFIPAGQVFKDIRARLSFITPELGIRFNDLNLRWNQNKIDLKVGMPLQFDFFIAYKATIKGETSKS